MRREWTATKITTDPSISGIISHADGSNYGVPIEIDLDGNGVADTTTWTAYDGTGAFTANLTGWLQIPWSGTVLARPMEYDSSTSSLLAGAWAPLSFSLQENPNSAPTAADDYFTIETNSQAVQLQLLRNDNDPDSDQISIVQFNQPSHGSVTLGSDQKTLSYTPTAGFIGSDSLSYQIQDDDGKTSTAIVTLEIHPGDSTLASARVVTFSSGKASRRGFIADAPSASLDADVFRIELQHGQRLLAVTHAADSNHETAISNLNGYLRVFNSAGIEIASADQPINPQFGHLDPEVKFTAISSGTYYLSISQFPNIDYSPNTASLGQPASPQEYRIDLSIIPNQLPIGMSDTASANAGATLTISALANDSDPDGDAIDITLLSATNNAELQIQGKTILYTAESNYFGTDTWTYTVSDPFGATATVTVTVVVNGKPRVTPESVSTTEDSGLEISAIANDFDPEGGTIRAAIISDPLHGKATVLPNGHIAYTPDPNFSGDDTIAYRVFDDHNNFGDGMATITVTPINDSPVAVPDAYTTSVGGAIYSGGAGVLSNDVDVENAQLTATITQTPTHGVLTLNSNGSFQYFPSPGYVGTDTFTYRASDGSLQSSDATVTITIEPVAIESAPDTFNAAHGAKLQVATPGVLGNDASTVATLVATLVSPATHGTVTLRPNGSFDYVVSNPSFIGTDRFWYRVSDGTGNSAATAVDIEISNDTPQGKADIYYVLHDTTLSIPELAGVLANDTDAPWETLTASLTSDPSHGVLTLSPNGSFYYNPTVGFVGTDSFSYRTSDGAAQSAETIVTLVIQNSPATAFNDSYSIPHDRLSKIYAPGVLENDLNDEGESVTVSLIDHPDHGIVVIGNNGQFNYQPNKGYVGVDSFDYRVFDGLSSSPVATVTLNVTNQTPIARNDSYSVEVNDRLSIAAANGVLHNDEDAGDTLNAILSVGPEHGNLELNSNGDLIYTPDLDFVGIDSFSYFAFDGATLSNPATVQIRVTNDPIVARTDFYPAIRNHLLVVPTNNGVLANDRHNIGSLPSASVTVEPTNGALTLESNGAFSYQPTEDFVGADAFYYQVIDTLGNTSQGYVLIEVISRAPSTYNDRYQLSRGATLTATAEEGVLANDTDDDSILSLELTSIPMHGQFLIQPDGGFQYVPESSFEGIDTFTYRVSDGYSFSPITSVTISVVDTKPIARPDQFHTKLNQPLLVEASDGLLANDSNDIDQPIVATLIATPQHGEVSIGLDGSFIYTPDSGFVGEDTFTYRAADSYGQSEATPVKVLVGNRHPEFSGYQFSLLHGTTVSRTSQHGLLSAAYDRDGDPLSVSIASQPSHGKLSVVANGAFSYSAAVEYRFFAKGWGEDG